MRLRPASLVLFLAALALPAQAEFPYPSCDSVPGCTDPYDYASYLFLGEGDPLPNDYDFNPATPDSGSGWKYQGVIEGGPADGVVGGLNIVEAWRTTTGRPDVVVAVLDSGINWDASDVRSKVALRLSELPIPSDANPPVACTGIGYDCDGNGAVTVDDFEGITCDGLNGVVVVGPALGGNPALLDGQDLIRACSDGFDGYGSDDDGNGFVDDIAGWDFQDDDNDPADDVRYGHGTGEAQDQAGEANNGSGFPGVAPNELYLPLKVADSFVAVGTDFARAMVYAADWSVDAISEALGTVTVGPVGQAAINYAYERGIPLIASAADEQAQHHNYPAAYDHTIWVNSIRNGDDTFLSNNSSFGSPNLGFDILNGCTNHGGRAWATIPSTGCSSEATGRSGGITGLIISHGKNLIDLGEMDPYPGLGGRPFSAEEIRQIFRWMAEDIDHSADPSLNLTVLVQFVIQVLIAPPGFPYSYEAQHFPAGPGWDQFTGYGRPDVGKLAELNEDNIPPEADLTGGPKWFDIIDPQTTASVDIIGSAKAERRTGFTYTVSVGCGIEPTSFTEIDSAFSATALHQQVLATWDPSDTEAACPFSTDDRITLPDEHVVTLLLEVVDTLGNHAEDRRAVALDHDPTLQFPPLDVGASGESSPALADVNRDGVLDIVYGTAAGEVHVLDGATGQNLPGFPATTNEIDVHDDDPASGFGSGAVPTPREPIAAPVAADDLDGDGRVEIVAASFEGGLYVWDDHGNPRAGFPVFTDPALSAPEHRDPRNDSDPGIISAPTLANLDGEDYLEIIVGALDGHVYAWDAMGDSVPGFPVRLADTSQVSVDPVTGKSTPLPDKDVFNRGRKIVGSPGVGDIDNDGMLEIIAGTTEEYGSTPEFWASPSNLFEALREALATAGIEEFDLDVSSRVYALNHDGSLVPNWPVRTPQLISQLLPSVATGTSSSFALADIDDNPGDEVVAFAFAGPAIIYDGNGDSILPPFDGNDRPLDIDFATQVDDGENPLFPLPGFPAVPDTAGTFDAPFFPALGSGAFGDIDGDDDPEYVAATAGLRKLVDVLVPGMEAPGFHSIAAWHPEDGSVVSAFPMPMDDMQFFSSPGLADVSGDGIPDVIQGSGTYMVHAFAMQPDGSAAEVADWPKFTHGWAIPAPTPGDVDGDGLIEVVGGTREGKLFVWNTPAVATSAAIPWQGFGGDRRNTQNQASGVSPLAPDRDPLEGLLWLLESIENDLQDIPRANSTLAIFLPLSIEAVQAGLDGARLQRTRFTILRFLLTLPSTGDELEILAARLVHGLHDAASRQLGQVECDPSDTFCNRCQGRAQSAFERGEMHLGNQREAQATRHLERALRMARICSG